MHVFIAGASGILGRAVIPRLLRDGHRVTGLGRTPDKLLLIDRLGAAAVRGDILDTEALRALLVAARPDIVINLATAIPLRLKVEPRDWEPNDRIRVDGTLSLARGCEAAGVSLLIQESVGYVCTSRGADWITEESPRSRHPFLKATVQMEDIVRSAKTPGTILRLGALMAPDSWHTQQSVAALRRGMLPIIGRGNAFLSMIHVDDAARAIVNVIALPDVAAGATYSVVDSAPAAMSEVFPYAARVLNAPEPKHVPALLAKLIVGSVTVDILTASYRMSNRKIREEISFEPEYPTYKETWKQIAQSLSDRNILVSEELPFP